MMNSYYNEDLPLYGYTKKTSNNKCRYCIFILWGTTLILSFIGGYYIDKKNMGSVGLCNDTDIREQLKQCLHEIEGDL